MKDFISLFMVFGVIVCLSVLIDDLDDDHVGRAVARTEVQFRGSKSGCGSRTCSALARTGRDRR